MPAELVDERKRGLVRRLNRSCVDPWCAYTAAICFLPSESGGYLIGCVLAECGAS